METVDAPPIPAPTPVVYVVDDDEAIRDVLEWLIGSVGLETRTFASAEAFLAAFDADQPGCLLLDVRMPGRSGLEVQRLLRDQDGLLPVILVTGHADVEMAVRAMKDGAFDFFEKPYRNQALLDAVQKAVAESLRRWEARLRERHAAQRLECLTTRERQVFDLVVAGETSKAIARTLGISIKTVEAHRAQVMRKLEADSLAQLMRLVRLVRTI